MDIKKYLLIAIAVIAVLGLARLEELDHQSNYYYTEEE